jgi:hypothetical protein
MKVRYAFYSLIPLVAVLFWSVQAQTSGHAILSGYAFRPDMVFNNSSFSYASGGALVGWPSSDNHYECFYAPLNLPDGATIKELEARVLDENERDFSNDDRVNVYLTRFDYTDPQNRDPEGALLIEARTPARSTAVQYIRGTATDSVPVDNLKYAYHVSVCLNHDQRIWTVRVDFDYATYLPLISGKH